MITADLLENSALCATAAAALAQINTGLLGEVITVENLPGELETGRQKMKMILFFATRYQKYFPKPKEETK